VDENTRENGSLQPSKDFSEMPLILQRLVSVFYLF
jgi:hypothetical protein